MIDIIKIYEKYNIKYWIKGKNVTNGWVNIKCPVCDDNSNHLGFNLDKKYYNCWKCGFKQIKDVFNKLNIPLIELNNNSLILEKLNKKETIVKKEFKLPGAKIIEHTPPFNYLLKRNFAPDYIINKYKLLYCNHLDLNYRFRIVIPIIYNNQIISFTTRDYTDKQKIRYISCPKEMEIIEHKKILYNLDNCKNDKIIVVEGIFDCWRLGDDCCATFGINYTKEQINLLLKYKQIYICFDNEKQAQIQAENLGNILSGIGKDVYIIKIDKNYKDLAEMPQNEANSFKKTII